MAGKFADKMQKYMMGRNGIDDLGRASLIASLVMLVASFIFGFVNSAVASVLTWIALIFIIYSYFRMLSKNISKRSAENAAWVKKSSGITLPIRRFGHFCGEWKKYHKNYQVFRCKSCGQTLKVPKGKGKIKVTCPKCKKSFTTKS
ncbi:MAG: hypothetical protein LKF61_00285 [Eggerthellaceae bacterium]|jgi:uncharacterized paraquat-inducible protein A|nr:hypothetical protein [Eggerthellaceae bacterium]MCH4220383.1 hypothetical protein [Eggerthellaceae bacterium]